MVTIKDSQTIGIGKGFEICKVSKRNGKVNLKFTATSEPELFRWVLSFGPEASVFKPDWLVEQIKDALKSMQNNYSAKNR